MDTEISVVAGQWALHEFEPSTEKPASCQFCGRPKVFRWHTNRDEDAIVKVAPELLEDSPVVTVDQVQSEPEFMRRRRERRAGPTSPPPVPENGAMPRMPVTDNAEDSMEGFVGPERKRMPGERASITAPATVGGFKFYLTAGMYEDGTFGELFVKGAGKEGSTMQGLIDGYATMFSIGVQYGAELEMLCRKFAHTRFEPMGPTDDPEIPYAFSLLDYIARWLALHFGSKQLNEELAKIAEEMRR